MSSQTPNLDALRDIRQIMDRSSRFISLSGWSGVVAGLSALVGAFLAHQRISRYYVESYGLPTACPSCLRNDLLWIAAVVFGVALTAAFLFTYRKSRQDGTPIWGASARRLLWNTLFPMAVGAVVILKMMDLKVYELVPASSLIFYGLALLNGSKYTMGEVRYLGYGILITGLVNLGYPGQGIYFWAFGFGILHILYGLAMWWKHEKKG